MVYSVLLDKGTDSEVTSPTSQLTGVTQSRPFHFADWILQSRLANPVLCHGRRLMLPAHDRSTKRDSQVKRCFHRKTKTVKSEKSVNTTPWLFTSSLQHRILNGCEMANHTSNVNTSAALLSVLMDLYDC